MRTETSTGRVWIRSLTLAGIVAAGLIGIVGSGGGASVEGCGFFIAAPCNYGPFNFDPIASVSVSPQYTTVQVGGAVDFKAAAAGFAAPSYSWCKRPQAATTCVPIGGATGPTYRAQGLNLADDGASIRVTASGTEGSTTSMEAKVAVSSMPGVVIQDTEFAVTDWIHSAAPTPALNGPIDVTTQSTTGGNPGALRNMVDTLSAGQSSIRVFNIAQAFSYDPATQGAIYVIDYVEDCRLTSSSAWIGYLRSTLLVEQGARRFSPAAGYASCGGSSWLSHDVISSLRAAELQQVDGPPCAVGAICPDFSATASPLRFGYVREAAQQSASAPAGTIAHGIDNWKVTVWRR